MKIIIVGYGEMFQALIAGVLKTEHEVVGVFRHENALYNPIKRFFYDLLNPTDDYNFVKNLELNDIKAPSVNSKDFIKAVKKSEADIILVGSWSERFEMQTINSPKKACINVHPSLLPKYRGPNPYTQVILNNEDMTGVTFHIMDVGYDSGPILHQKSVDILKNDTAASLRTRCCDCAKREILILLNKLQERLNNPVSQDEKNATYFSHIKLKDLILNFKEETTDEIDKKIRAFYPWNKCVIPYKNQFFEFDSYKIYNKVSKKEASEIVKVTNNSVFIVCADNKVIEFSNLKIKLPFSKYITKFFLDEIIKTETKAI